MSVAKCVIKMPAGFWDYIHLSRSRTNDDNDDEHDPHNLQDGLFQIASQTCNILVQVNNTNNINFHSGYSEPSTSTGTTRKTTFYDLEQSVVLLKSTNQGKVSAPSTPTKGKFHRRLSEYKRRLSVSWRDSKSFIT